MKSFALLFILISYASFGQSDFSLERHSLTISPLSVTFHKNISLGHSLKYRFNISNLFFTELSTDGTIIKQLDPMKNSWGSYNSVPNLNQSHLIFGGNTFVGAAEKMKKNKIGGFIGFHYLQHATQRDEYWIVDSTESGGHNTITGFRTYSIIAGFQFQRINTKKQGDKLIIKHRHNLNVSYLFGVDLTFTGITEYDTHYEKASIPNNFHFNRNGVKIAYSFEHRLSNILNLSWGVEYLWAPFIDYSPNSDFFVPRGGEGILPSFANIKVGLTFLK
ncbi:MAG: hypothetical protein QNK23_08670 [Crocinitomicaceae bacterium]|nr:hypothetical protein [Crocinitomicaceae bacterium]